MLCDLSDGRRKQTMEAENVTDYTVALQEEMGDQIQVACLHGKMKQAQKERYYGPVAEEMRFRFWCQLQLSKLESTCQMQPS